jgi:lipopolysaccharide biosynthesis glycosyltransferase
MLSIEMSSNELLVRNFEAMRIAICTVATRDYITGAEILFGSLRLFNNLTAYDLICFTDVKESDRPNMLQGVRLIPLSEKLQSMPTSSNVPRFHLTLQKFQAIKLLEEEKFDFVVLIDSDIMCSRKLPIDSLFESPAPLKGVLDYACEAHYGLELKVAQLEPRQVINTGFLVISRDLLSYVNYETIEHQLIPAGHSYDGGDQGYFNWIIQKFGIPVEHLNLNFNYALDINYPLVVSPPSMLHFTGGKPWLNHPKSRPSFFDRSLFSAALSITEMSISEFDRNDKVRARVIRNVSFGWMVRLLTVPLLRLASFIRVSRTSGRTKLLGD